MRAERRAFRSKSEYEYVYDEYFDCYICPNNAPLKYSTTNRDGYREYKSDPSICKNCKLRDKCTNSKNMTKVVTIHLWTDYIDMCEYIRHTDKYKELYRLRKEKIERVFADAKEKHAMRYTPYRGLSQVTKWVRLKFACMNLKKLAIWKSKDDHIPTYFHNYSAIYFKTLFRLLLKQGFSTV